MSSDTRVIHLEALGDADAPFPGPRLDLSQVGPYRIIRPLGRGGMGAVYLAEAAVSCPVPMGKQVAIKILHKSELEERRRFEREAAYMQSLRHPGIVRVLDSGEHDGRPYLVMQYVEGKRVDDLIIKGPMEQRQAADVVVQALEALHVAHLAGILHRDIKPGNIMLDPRGAVKILDFGLASHMHHESRLTRTGNVVGTPAYMSPEQACGNRQDLSRRSDIYGMGACLYELLTGFQPYTADNSVAVLRRIIDDPLVPPSQLRPELSRDLETIVVVAMAKDPRDRYATAEAMAADLRRYLAGERIHARPVGRTKLFARSCWRHRRAVATGALATFVVASAAVLGVVHLLRTQRATDAATQSAPPVVNEWTTEWQFDGALDAPGSPVRLAPYTPSGTGAQLATLPPVTGPVRLTVTAELTAPVSVVELFVNDRDVDRGYRLRLEGGPDGDVLSLMRDGKRVKTLGLGKVARNQPWKLSLEHEDAYITARFNDIPPMKFLDLVPLEGQDAAATYIAFAPGSSVVHGVLLERQKTGEYVSALREGDGLRQDGRFATAQKRYEEFLRDHPDSPRARDARLRIALCLEGRKDDEHALARFIEVAQESQDDPRYALVANFHAWACQLRLGQYENAERQFETIRSEYNFDTLVSAIPEDTLNELLKDYLDRAQKLAATEPQRAARLYVTASELAAYLKITDAMSNGRTGAGDVLLSLGRREEARTLYFGAASDQRLPVHLRMKAMLKVAEVDRLNDMPSSAIAAYTLVVNTPTQGEDYSQWARLWLGDLYLETGDRDQAVATWTGSSEALSPPGLIMAKLLEAGATLPVSDNRYFANDYEYFIGRIALLAGDIPRYSECLQNVVRIGPAYDWPTPLAKHLLATDPAEPSQAPAPTTTPRESGVPPRE
ncbi:MAG: protein kinase [Planctomycetes bacterium]|nr:protein kinase [Planctomycetota bacterium]